MDTGLPPDGRPPTRDDGIDVPSRRTFVVGTLLAAPGLMLGGCAWSRSEQQGHAGAAHAWRFFTQDEAAFVRSALARLIPADALGPGAVEAGVDRFIDAQLAGDYGRAERWYMQGPFRLGTEQQGYQLPLTPAQVYRVAISQVDAWCHREHGKAFAMLSADQQNDALHALEKGQPKMDAVPADFFFDLLWTNAQEGFLADPIYGGNRDFAGWKLIGFPGPRYNYVEEITRYGQPYREPYVSLGGRQPHMEV